MFIKSLALSPFPREDPHPNYVPSLVANKLLCAICLEIAVNYPVERPYVVTVVVRVFRSHTH